MLVLCNGMPRSASTWSFNVALELLRRTGAGSVHGDYDENAARFLKSAPPVSHLILKSHLTDPVAVTLAQVGAASVIYTWRNVADAVVSFMRMFEVEFDRAYAVIAESLDLYRRHRRSGSALILSYRDITDDHLNSVRRVADFLRLDASAAVIAEVDRLTALENVRRKVQEVGSLENGHRLLRRDKTPYDPETLLNVNHILDGGTGYGRKALNASQLRQLDDLVEEKGPLE
jgi:Sulfotransferase domain